MNNRCLHGYSSTAAHAVISADPQDVVEDFSLLTSLEQSFSIKGQILNMLGFAVSVTTTQRLSHKSSHKQHVNEKVWLCPSRTLGTKTGSRLDLTWGPSLLIPALDENNLNKISFLQVGYVLKIVKL